MIRSLLLIHFKSPKIFFGLLILLLLFSCVKTDEEKAKVIVSNSIKAHGGMKAYDNLNSISFIKRTKLYRADGSIESDITQKQSFQLQPDFLTKIEWEKDSQKHKIFYNGIKAIKTVEGQLINDSTEISKAENSAKAASYVFFQPFKLLKDDTILIFDGETDLNDSTDVFIVKVNYNNETSTDQWKYYFNEDGLLVANSVFLSDHNSLIENLEYQKASGLIFNKYRKSYRIDTLLNKQYLRAEYWYDDLKFESAKD